MFLILLSYPLDAASDSLADSIYQRVNSVISFVAENPVRAIASHTQVWLSKWYKEVRSALFFLSQCIM